MYVYVMYATTGNCIFSGLYAILIGNETSSPEPDELSSESNKLYGRRTRERDKRKDK